MVLEATYLCIDNSDFMRNGDFAPSRMEAQQDAVNLLAGAKTQASSPRHCPAAARGSSAAGQQACASQL